MKPVCQALMDALNDLYTGSDETTISFGRSRGGDFFFEAKTDNYERQIRARVSIPESDAELAKMIHDKVRALDI